jgi:uncharacterized membrane protein YraQ (UPF0718 family)
MSPGTAFVFLLAGQQQCGNQNNGRQVSWKAFRSSYVGVISLCALGAGILLDWIYLSWE